MYIEYVNNALGAVRNPKRIETKLTDGTLIGRPEGGWDDGQLATLGLYPVEEVARPVDTLTGTFVQSVELATPGDPTTAVTVWTGRDFTIEELEAKAAAETAAADRDEVKALLVTLADGLGMDTTDDLKAALQVLAQEAVTGSPAGL